MRIVIAGAGLAGLSLALALKQSLADSFEIVVADPVLESGPRPDERAYAISAAGRRMFEALGVWDGMVAGAQAITDMVITDSRTRDVVRPTYLTFGSTAEDRASPDAGEPFAHMVWSKVINAELGRACTAAGVILRPDVVRAASAGADRTRVELASGAMINAALVVAADGARSRLREQAGIGWVGWSYEQSGIVATIGHERDHGGRAIEHFLPAGPFAILPLPPRPEGGHRSSIVWTEATTDAAALLTLHPDDLLEELETRFGHQLGAIHFETPAKAYPLSFGMARRFVGERLALLGDAAHVIHPIAGQGLNLGLKDVAGLAEVIVDAARLGLDVGSGVALASYEQARRFDTVAMGVVTDGLNKLFSNDLAPVRLARDLGLGLVDRMPGLKDFFISQAAGRSASQPRLLRGEPI
jgi:2-octaprenyl-6-methoxyphenol hydroxylase